tara:strand:+ start:991 stop:1182 length:192 start_codon:yes stop_codon:yes gene_type:complete
MEMKTNEMEFIDEIATQITEMNFGADTYYNYKFTDEAKDYYNEMYDEYEDLYIRMILQIPNKI